LYGGLRFKEDAYAFYRGYVMRANGSILEPMCGTGRFLLPLFEEGFNIHGFDASEHMLEALHKLLHMAV
jgi:2-polyprenyl-3-methyl-5-hydroxy-6-metoxy-1,4-benzoquinol methylase